MKFEGYHDNSRGQFALGVETYVGKINPMFIKKREYKYSATVYIHLGQHMWQGIVSFGKVDSPAL